MKKIYHKACYSGSVCERLSNQLGIRQAETAFVGVYFSNCCIWRTSWVHTHTRTERIAHTRNNRKTGKYFQVIKKWPYYTYRTKYVGCILTGSCKPKREYSYQRHVANRYFHDGRLQSIHVPQRLINYGLITDCLFKIEKNHRRRRQSKWLSILIQFYRFYSWLLIKMYKCVLNHGFI